MSSLRFLFPAFLLLLFRQEACYLYSCQARWQECQKKLGLPLFVFIINNIYYILKRTVQTTVEVMYRKCFLYLDSNHLKGVILAHLCLSCFIY